MSADAVMEVFERAADAVAQVLASTSDWGPSGLRHSQYAFDVTADDACRAVLHGAGLAVLSEESGVTAPDGSTVSADRPVVVVDPVDGSTNASRQVPWYATALCLVADGAPQVALVANHASGHRWRAIAGGGATRDGVPISSSGCAEMRRAIVATSGLPSHHYGWAQFRVLGASAPDMCLVADGTLDAWCDMNNGGHGVWDYAASVLICTEAGAVVGEVEGRDLIHLDHTARRSPMVAASADLLEVLAEHRRRGR